MPRARKGHAPRRGGQRRGGGARNSTQADSPSSDDEAASEVLSHYSSTSEGASIAEESLGNEVVDEQAQQEELEEKLKERIDDVADKSAKTRLGALESLRLAFSSRVLLDFLLERRLTLTDSLEKCLKKGKGEEQSLAATVLTLLCLQMGSGPEGEELFRSLRPLLVSILTDTSASLGARHSCATTLGMCCYIAAADVEDLISCLACLEGIFSGACREESSSALAPLQALHCCALQAWALLLTICPGSHISRVLDSQLPQLPQLLSSDSVHLRIAAGETIALLFELGRDLEEDFLYEDTDALCSTLRALATDSNKYRAKADRRRQRSIFRDVLHFIETGECQEETIKFGLECMYVDSWVRRRAYAAFKETLGSGVLHHLQNNELLRDIFDLGPVLVLDAAAMKASKISRFEKHLYNSAAFKARTKARSRVRDKRADVL
ncbi:interferon-related developmental regulator 2 isoform X1 [Trichosurus vulpecula]|uniref:interferon-related developmental regulator 2 isoform X1 n=1 Tax=Trichosurus vulpecula TaxID=9337 RepID=UPI00186B2A9F|nr:interferon-related developmental regulator 2 isoform X1 [Trichosurus vulpecula]